MIAFSHVVAEGLDSPLDLTLPAGGTAAVITPHERENEVIVGLLAGLVPPAAGELSLAGVVPHALKDARLSVFRRQLGVIYPDGGLLSNLNVWDNLTLQLSYFGDCSRADIESRGERALQFVGFTGSRGSLPARLTIFQRRQVAFARVVLGEPLILVGQSLFDGVSPGERQHLGRLVQEFRRQDCQRTALFLTSNPSSLAGIEVDVTCSRGGGALS